jgi:hypothetical protein
MQLLWQLQQSDPPQLKETAMHVLSSMFDSMRLQMLPHFGAFLQILAGNLSHPHVLVQKGALKAIQIIL